MTEHSQQADTMPASSAASLSSGRQKQPRYLLVAWILLLLLGALFGFASLSDLAADLRTELPTDHLEAFRVLTNQNWQTVQQQTPQFTHYITTLEIAYAVHELVFALLFLMIVIFPFRQRKRWSWWTCWVPMLANLTYTLTLAHFSSTTLTYSLVADIALPVLLLIHIPAFFKKTPQDGL